MLKNVQYIECEVQVDRVQTTICAACNVKFNHQNVSQYSFKWESRSIIDINRKEPWLESMK